MLIPIFLLIVLITFQIIIQSVCVQPKPMRKKKEIPISTFFKEQMNINRKSVNLQNKGITLIDEISPFLCSEIQVLNLKNNKLTSLKGIEQLSFLKQLDVSGNKITNCRQLLNVKGMLQLKKIYFSNNPFLSQPIDQDLLDIILQKQTDLDILSLELIKEVQNEQIKIIFLKNYLSKIKLHEELKRNQYIAQVGNKLKTQALINKIVPQFYSVIENPNLANSIKRETLDIKKRNNQTLESALAINKDNKEKRIDQLISNIVQILHQSNSFTHQRNFMLEVNLNNSTISFSPEKSKGFKNSVKIQEQAEFSPVKYIDFSKDDNTLQDIALPSNKPVTVKGKPGLPKIVEKLIFQQKDYPQDNIQTARKYKLQQFRQNMNKNIEDQLREVHQKKVKIQKNMRAKEQSQLQSENQIRSTKKFLTKTESQTSKNTNNYIKVVEAPPSSRGYQQEAPINISKTSSLAFSKGQTIKSPKYGKQSIASWKNTITSPEQLTLQNFEAIYYKTMTKIHPMFNLLHSPSESLKNEQKDTILQALKATHRQHYFQLLKQKISNLNLTKEIEQIKMSSEQRVQDAFQQNKDIYNENIRLKQQFQWVDSRNKALQQDYSKLYSKFKDLQNVQKAKSGSMAVMETSYKKIKQAYMQKTQEVQKYSTQDQKQDTITSKRQSNLRKKYLSLIIIKAKIWKQAIIKERQSKKRHNQQLIYYGFQAFRRNYELFKTIKQQINNRNYLTMKQHFKNWLFCNSLQRKEKKLQTKINLRNMDELIQLLRKNQGQNKMKKLKNIWALRFYKEQKLKKSIKEWVIMKQQGKEKRIKAQNYFILSYQNVYFKALKQLIGLRKKNTSMISQNRQNRIFQQQFRKLIYLMRKDLIINSQKQNRVRLFFQKSCRIRNYNQLKKNTQQLKKFRAKIHKARINLLGKMWFNFKERVNAKYRRMGKLSKYIRYINMKIIKKCLLREKMSFDLGNWLLNCQKRTFLSQMKFNLDKEKSIRNSWQTIIKEKQNKLKLYKLKFIKRLEIARLKGHNFVKHRVIEEMGVQMTINDNQTFQIIKQDQSTIQKCEQQIIFLKKQIQLQSNRQLMLITQKDQLLLSVNQSYEIIVELKKEIELLKNESLIKDEQYKNLVKKYNQIVKAIQNHHKMQIDPTKLI